MDRKLWECRERGYLEVRSDHYGGLRRTYYDACREGNEPFIRVRLVGRRPRYACAHVEIDCTTCDWSFDAATCDVVNARIAAAFYRTRRYRAWAALLRPDTLWEHAGAYFILPDDAEAVAAFARDTLAARHTRMRLDPATLEAMVEDDEHEDEHEHEEAPMPVPLLTPLPR